jgi:hypothetical protein
VEGPGERARHTSGPLGRRPQRVGCLSRGSLERRGDRGTPSLLVRPMLLRAQEDDLVRAGLDVPASHHREVATRNRTLLSGRKSAFGGRQVAQRCFHRDPFGGRSGRASEMDYVTP